MTAISTDAEVTRETIARIIDPIAFKAWQSSYDYSIAQGDTRDEAVQQADWSQKKACDDALTKADEIISLGLSTPAVEEELREALKPFAAKARAWDSPETFGGVANDDRVCSISVTVGELRRARTLSES